MTTARALALATAERVTSPTLTKIVANLEAAGLVQRSADPDDRRAARVSLTAAGKSRLKRLRLSRENLGLSVCATRHANDSRRLQVYVFSPGICWSGLRMKLSGCPYRKFNLTDAEARIGPCIALWETCSS